MTAADDVVSSLAPRVAPRVEVPFTLLPALSAELRAKIEAVAHAANERYVAEFLEGHNFCPFARPGRLAGETERRVVFADSADVEPLVEVMLDAARRPKIAVVQLVMPLIRVSPRDWTTFCFALTEAGNARLPEPAFACAPLHPALPYLQERPSALVPLFRRTPDPTIQWVRLSTIESLYEGRDHHDVFVPPDKIAAYLESPPKPSLYERTLDNNAKTTDKLGLQTVEDLLQSITDEAHARYAELLTEYGVTL